ncbi:NAD(P)-dependent oxidoreductase [Egicoccus sp. AB-alg6-2]|uniref:NAD(P)-dependent oxidoreductase n=1 Tax=Egicoccus sp. AB-alg6-2 TaxID=3242692 RepID=UPI00359CE807
MLGETVVAVLGTRYPDLSIEEAVLADHDVRLVTGDGADADAILAVAGEAELILCGSRPRFDAEVLARLSCRGIVRYGIGTDSIDLDAAREQGIWVARVSDYGTEAVAVHALALAMSGFRRVVASDRWVRAGNWGFDHLRPLHLPSASAAAVVGYGRIGRYAAGLFAGIGFRVLVHDPFVSEVAEGHEQVADLHDLLAAADVVSLHVPGNADGTPLLGAAELANCRPGSVLVNTARGSLIDPDALVTALRTGRPAVAALDVHAQEPVDASRFDAVADQVVLTPHTAWYSEESEADMRQKAARAAEALLRGERPDDVVVDPT